jgi:hypothetical protein
MQEMDLYVNLEAPNIKLNLCPNYQKSKQSFLT